MRIVVIGAVAAGTKAASKARREDPNAVIEIYTDEEYISYAGCGQPYYIGGEIKERDQLLARLPEQFKQLSNIDIFTKHRVTKILPDRKSIEINDLNTNETKTVPYDGLVIATGAAPIVPKLPGVDLPGVYQIRTIPTAIEIREKIDAGQIKNAVVVGGGYIGLEMVENLVENNINVTLVERLPQVAPIFDEEVAIQIKRKLEEKGVTVLLNSSLESVEGTEDTGVQSVTVNGESIKTDLVIMSIGVRPESKLANDAGIEVGSTGAIKVNDKMQTNYPDIYAGGDCVESTQLVTGKPTWVPLGSTANKHGRVIGTNITGGNATFKGILGTGIFRVFDLNVARTGITETEAKQEGYDYEAAIVPGGDKPHYMDAKTVVIKLIAEKSTRRVLGAQVWGQGSVDKSVDTLAAAINFKATVEDLIDLDLAYAPPFAPALGNVIVAANVLQNKLDKRTEGILPLQVKEKIDNNEPVTLIDVRPPEARTEVCTEECICIPLGMLPQKIDELNLDNQEIITSCLIGRGAAQAYRVLKHKGYKNVKYMDGGITTWPDPKPGK
jgi:NADPH-dependent 2,4-dienoyl-CoA reductase/sulfur reductase-like enzyme/rhodanese-related sulfurtransferase